MKKIFQKKKQSETLKKLSGYVDIKGYYPDIHIIKTSNSYAKAYRLVDPDGTDRCEYEHMLARFVVDQIEISTQICHIDGGDYAILSTKADGVDKALEIFQSLDYPGEQISIAEWVDLIAKVTQGENFRYMDRIGYTNSKGRPKGSIVPLLEPYAEVGPFMEQPDFGVDEDADKKMEAWKSQLDRQKVNTAKFGNRYIRTLYASSFPQDLCSPICTELIRVSDTINISFFARPINKEACNVAVERFGNKLVNNIGGQGLQEVKKVLVSENPLMDTLLLISVSAKTVEEVNRYVDHITTIASQYMVELNALGRQQISAFKSMIPLGISYVKSYKIFEKPEILGCLPLSWRKHMETGVLYGRDTISGKQIYYDRAKGKGIGFILGSEGRIVESHIIQEADQIATQGKNVAIYAIDANLIPQITAAYPQIPIAGKLLEDTDSKAYRESFFKTALLSIFGATSRRDLSFHKKEMVDAILSRSYRNLEEFKEAVMEQDKHLEMKANAIKDPIAYNSESEEPGVHFYVCQGDRYQTRVLQLIQALYRSKADVIYVLNADLICNSGIFNVLKGEHPNTIYTLSAINRDGKGIRDLYASNSVQSLIQESDFINITKHTVLDRLHLSNSLDFSKEQKNFITSADEFSGILISGDSLYTYTHG